MQRLFPTFQVAFRTGVNAQAKVLYVDRGLAIVNKPPGFVTQYAHDSNQSDTLSVPAAELIQCDQDGLEQRSVLYPLHRLDKGTTGCLAFARSAAVARSLSQQFQQKTAKKVYLALVYGNEESFEGKRKGEIRVSIALKNGRPCIAEPGTGKETSTDWELIASSSRVPLSLLRLNLHTGVKHQLRVHLANILKVPIIGDQQHSDRPTESINLSIPEDRLFLHASQISFFRYRSTGKQKRFRLGVRAPLPHDFLQLCMYAGIDLDPAYATGGLLVDDKPVCDNRVPELNGYWLDS